MSYEITNVELVCHTVYFDSAFNNTFGAMLGQIGGVQYHSTGYNSVVNVIAASVNLNVNIPVRAMSLKGLLYSLQDTATVTNQGSYSLSTRLARTMQDFVQYIGGASYPLRKIDISGTDQGHMLSEVLKLFNNLHNIHAGNSLIDGPGSTVISGANAGNESCAAYYPRVTTFPLSSQNITRTDITQNTPIALTTSTNSRTVTVHLETPGGTVVAASTYSLAANSISFSTVPPSGTTIVVVYAAISATMLSDNACAFAFGYLFENFNGQNMISGLDMSSQSMPVNLRCNFNTTIADTSILTTFVHSDVIYTLTADGVISVTS